MLGLKENVNEIIDEPKELDLSKMGGNACGSFIRVVTANKKETEIPNSKLTYAHLNAKDRSHFTDYRHINFCYPAKRANAEEDLDQIQAAVEFKEETDEEEERLHPI